MATPYLGEIKIFAGNFAPYGWAFCDGTLLSVQGYDLLYSLIKTTYGGDGVTSFGLPDLRGRVPIHMGESQGGPMHNLGEAKGIEIVSLITAQLPAHTHPPAYSLTGAASPSPENATPATTAKSSPLYVKAAPQSGLLPTAMQSTGGGQPHENRQPYLPLVFIIAVQGQIPPHN